MKYSPATFHKRKTETIYHDLESLINMVVYLNRGKLPWSGFAATKGTVSQKEQAIYLKVSRMNTREEH